MEDRTKEHQKAAAEHNKRVAQAAVDERTVEIVCGILKALQNKLFQYAEASSTGEAYDAIHAVALEIGELVDNPIELDDEE